MTNHDIKQIFINFDYRELIELPKMIKMGYIQTNDEVEYEDKEEESKKETSMLSQSFSLEETSHEKSSDMEDKLRKMELEGGT